MERSKQTHPGLGITSEDSLSLLTDLYQISMAYSYWKSGRQDVEAVFNLFFRSNPFEGGYAISCGLEQAIEYIEAFRFTRADTTYLGTLKGSDGQPLFCAEFLRYLEQLELKVQVDAIPEGRLVFAHEPLLRVQGPILQCQLLETALLNILNFQTLIATKAARVKTAAGTDQVLEFGLRRAQGIDGSLTASRAAYVGGCDATSNVLAGKAYGIPVKGTHAHSWVMSFPSEREAFDQFARAMPNNSIFLVDTYDTLDGVRNAIEAGRWLRSQGNHFTGIRLDSGDLAFLSIEARRLLDEAGFPDAIILASNDLDEHLIEDLKRQGARIDAWGVGTRLVTAYDQPALGGVYKLAALREPGSAEWSPRIKLSEQTAKTTTPGLQQVRRFMHEGHLACDMIYDVTRPPRSGAAGEGLFIIDPSDPTRRRRIPAEARFEDLLVPAIRDGRRVLPALSLGELRTRAASDRALLHPTIQRFLNPHRYPVGLEPALYAERERMILAHRGFQP